MRRASLPIAIIVALALAPLAVKAQQPSALTLWEWSGRDSLDLSGRSVQIVDANSSIGLALDHAALRARLQTMFADSTGRLLAERARAIVAAIDVGGRAFAGLQAAGRRFDQSGRTPADSNAYRAAYDTAIAATLPVIGQAARGSALRTALNAGITAAVTTGDLYAPYRAIFDSAAAEAARLRAAIDSQVAAGGVVVLLGAFLNSGSTTRPIHIPGFDTYVPGERVVLPRITLALSGADSAALRRIDEQARLYNEGGFSALVGDLGSAVPAALATLATTLQPCTQGVPQAISQTLAAARTQALVVDAQQAVSALEGTVRPLVARYAGAGGLGGAAPVDLLAQAAGDLQGLVVAVSGAYTAVQALVDGAPRLLASGAALAPLTAAAGACKQALDGTRARVQSLLRVVGPVQSLGRAVSGMQGFGAEVIRHDLGSLPATAEIDLPDAGRRAAGDVVIIRLAAGRRDQPPVDLEARRLILERVQFYVSTAVSLAFAHPLGPNTLNRYFQAGAAYSVLLKPLRRSWARTSMTYNELIDLGVGFNVVALDLDKDDKPDLGFGLVLSGFRDMLQVGMGYDVGADHGYWLFGVRLPMLGSQLPLGSNTAASN